MDKRTIKNLEEKVRYCLNKYPDARNSDTRLTLLIIFEYLPRMITKSTEQYPDGRDKYWLETDALYIVREDNVKRVRAKIQNEQHLFLPTDPEVRRQRRINEDVWRAYCAEPV